MNYTWLEEVEQNLERRFEGFLRANPYQELLLHQQHQQDCYASLCRQRGQLQEEAKELRRQLLKLVKTIKEWINRSQRAREAGASSLADRADNHLKDLLKLGRNLWSNLEDLGYRFKEVEEKISYLSHLSSSGWNNLEREWANFEEEQELDQLKKEHGLKN